MTAIETPPARFSRITRLTHWIVLSWGWRRALVAFGAGAVSALAMAPFDAWPVLFFTFPILVWLVDGAAAGRLGGLPSAAIAGWWFGFGYFLAGLYWVGYAFLVDAKTFGWLMPFAVIALPAGMACYTALGLGLARMLWTRGPTRLIALAIALTAAEWLRGHLFSGFPWNVYGYALTGPLVLAQSAALIGIWGLTFIAVAVFASPAVLTDERADTRRPWLPLALGVVLLAALAGYGAMRLSRTPTAFVEGVRLRIMQPNLQQDQKFNYGAEAEGDEPISRVVGPLDRPAIGRRAGRDPSDLAGIGVSIPADARARRAGADRGAAAGGHGADHRRGPRPRSAARPERSSAPTIRST